MPRKESRTVRWLHRLENAGNRLPDPLTLFLLMAGVVALGSWAFHGVSADVPQRNGEVYRVAITSLLSTAGIRWIFTSAVDNFIGFAPLGPVLTVMLGIGFAERTGLVAAALRAFVSTVPNGAITAAVVFAGVMSSVVADAGYVVLTPLAAIVFAGLGRHPLAGLAAAYAGVSGGYSANLLLTGLDPLLARLTEQAARIVDPTAIVHPASNYYFMVASTVLITVLGTIVTSRIVEPSLGHWSGSATDADAAAGRGRGADIGKRAKAALQLAACAGIATTLLLALLVIPRGAPLRGDGLAPFYDSIELLVCIVFAVSGLVYGLRLGSIRNDRDAARMAADSMVTMGPYIALAFAAGQFVAWFNHSNLGPVLAIKGADGLAALGITGIPLLLAFLFVAAAMNLLVGSASAKWAFLAPVFVPMLALRGIEPALAQAAYRVGDSCTNIISPLMPYLPILIVFARRYDPRAGVGTLVSAMLPYSLAFLAAWTALLLLWLAVGLPLGPGG